jgi:hypothetical protein
MTLPIGHAIQSGNDFDRGGRGANEALSLCVAERREEAHENVEPGYLRRDSKRASS